MGFRPLDAQKLTGDEPFNGLSSTVNDFWSYAVRDLRSNTVRGVLAEWLVAKAVGATELLPEWHEFDVRTPAGTRIEVKSSAYLQAWPQRRLSAIKFSGLTSRKWDRKRGFRTSERSMPTSTSSASRLRVHMTPTIRWTSHSGTSMSCRGPALSRLVNEVSGWRGSQMRRNQSVSTALPAQSLRPAAERNHVAEKRLSFRHLVTFATARRWRTSEVRSIAAVGDAAAGRIELSVGPTASGSRYRRWYHALWSADQTQNVVSPVVPPAEPTMVTLHVIPPAIPSSRCVW